MRKIMLVGALGALALTLTACGGTTKKAAAAPTTVVRADPMAALKLVGDATDAAKSAKIDETVRTSTGTMHMTGAVSWANGLRGELAAQLPTSPMSAKLTRIAGSPVTYRYATDGLFLKLTDQAAGELGVHWISYPYSELGTALGASGSALQDSLKKVDPVAGVDALIASGKVTKAGTDTVNGTPATHYTGDLSAADLTAVAGKLVTQEQVDALKKDFDAAGITGEHIEVWVDSHNLLLKRAETAATKVGQVQVTVTYSDYGVTVNTQAPDPSDSIDVAELLKAAQSQSKG